jgi:hypothetical protein
VVTPENQVIGIVSYLDVLRKLGARLASDAGDSLEARS